MYEDYDIIPKEACRAICTYFPDVKFRIFSYETVSIVSVRYHSIRTYNWMYNYVLEVYFIS